MKKLNIELTDSQYGRLEFVAGKLGIGTAELLKALIPDITVFSEQTVRITSDKAENLKLKEDFDVNRLRELIESLEKQQVALMLCRELRYQVLETGNSREFLTSVTEKRLRRWANPGRIDERTQIALPIAKEICVCLFGFNPGRGEQ
ncbi:MAG: hypothetical protein JW806_03265 [Sedimentisphaerales bacterium]|nr:hypothetical protein [Sedimentisphaerales bacterium]